MKHEKCLRGVLAKTSHVSALAQGAHVGTLAYSPQANTAKQSLAGSKTNITFPTSIVS